VFVAYYKTDNLKTIKFKNNRFQDHCCSLCGFAQYRLFLDVKHTTERTRKLKALLCHIVENRAYLELAMPVQYELRRLFHLMNIQTHRSSTQKALFLGACLNS